ncbi:hypothetical protein B9K06_12900 [Bacillus sp. OG2]|nr:hypothetical protein B9K06_12900 [Bacillus sp. OG2]
MRINHNIVALNTHRQLTSSNSSQSKSMEKLSSGLRINRAGDDAAGLAISEKMRGQIRGLNQASRNAQDGISMIQTAEGGASVIHDMLQRGRELSVQAANDTLTDEDRQSLNDEIVQLKEQISATANNTEFNTKKLLNKGSVSSASATLIPALKDKLEYWIDDALNTINTNLGVTSAFGSPKTMNVEFYESPTGAAASMGTADGGNTLTLRLNMQQISSVMDASDDGWGQVDALVAHEIVHALQFTKMPETLNGGIPTWFTEGLATSIQGGVPFLGSLGSNSSAAITPAWTGDYGSAYAAVMTLHEATTGGIQAIVDRLEAGDTLDQALAATTQAATGDLAGVTDFADTASFVSWFNSSADVDSYLDGATDFADGIGSIAPSQGTARTLSSINDVIANDTTIDNPDQFNYVFQDTSAAGEQLVFQVGANEGQTVSMSTYDLTTEGLALGSADISTRIGAEQAIDMFDSAIGRVSAVRGSLGALQNRLEHTISNLENAAENLTSSESRIRDVDMANEMMTQTKNSILSQAAQAMLAQANQQPQGVLQLLR